MSSAAVYASPLFWPLQSWLGALPGRPDAAALAGLVATHRLPEINGRPLRFVPDPLPGLAYETRIWARGEVETRPDNWHDFFNALVWCAFPQTKQAITAAHVAAMQPQGGGRGTTRDALTHFDECGIVVLSAQPQLLELLEAFQWRELFVERRGEVLASMRFIVFGHATYESLLAPFRGLTAKAILRAVPPATLALPDSALLATVDTWLPAALASGRYQRPRDFQPLPLLGIPGVTPANEDPGYYDDTWQFRPGRRQRVAATLTPA